MGNDMEMQEEQDNTILAKGNKEACRRYYARNAKATKRRVLLHEISRFGRISKIQTLEKWDISIYDVIEAFRKYRGSCPQDDLEEKILQFRILVGNML